MSEQMVMKVPESAAYISFDEEIKPIRDRQDVGILSNGRKLVVEKDKRNHVIGIQIE